jgi:hypothetical protein
VYDAVSIEKLNIPTVTLVNSDFAMDAMSASSSQGMPAVRVVPEVVPCESSIMEEIEAGVDAVMDDIITALSKPLTREEKSPRVIELEKPSKIIFKGDLEEVNRFFYQRGWTDGLPVIPPTEAALAEMLTGTDLPPDHMIGKIVPRLGKATVEKIAINAVMAGALPTAMPLLIAGVEAILDPRSAFGTWQVSTGSWAPFWIINGPVRHDLNINSSSGALSPGNIANATIGRAMQLIIKNIGAARPGIEDMGVIGNPGKYTMVIAENEEDSPWEPLHVEQGFKKEDSTVTLFFPQTFNQTLTYGTDDKGILSALIYNVNPGRTIGGMNCFILVPSHARALARKGWGKREIKDFISENATAPFYRLRHYLSGVRGIIGKNSSLSLAFNPMDPIRLVQNPDNTMILVAGGAGAFMASLHSAGGWLDSGYVTKKIVLPPNWRELVERYKEVKPAYVRY